MRFDSKPNGLHVLHMNKHIQIREIPDETHRKLKARAAAEGVSMTEYLKRLIDQDLKRPQWAAIKARMTSIAPLDISGEDIVAMIREERDSR
jgi:plasmid stability protein